MSELPLPEQFTGFAASVQRDGATTYAAICRGAAEAPELLELIGEAPLAQRRPNLLLAAVHFLLLGGVTHPLAEHYDTVTAATGQPFSAPDRDVVPDFRAFCADHRADLLELIATRSTQTNEVGRCAALFPALCAIAADDPEGRPLALLDLGTSAGLNLLFDRYAYAYRQRFDGAVAAGSVLRAGDLGSNVSLECTVRSEIGDLPPLSLPDLRERAGLDLDPIDPRSETEARWLLACLWPDNLPRFTRLRAALDVARTAQPRPVLHRGDIIRDLDRVARTISSENVLVIFHSWVAAYLSEAGQRELVTAVHGVAAERPAHYLYAESPAETPGLPTPPSPSTSPNTQHATALVHVALDGTDPGPVRLADLHPHGTWVNWWMPNHHGRHG